MKSICTIQMYNNVVLGRINFKFRVLMYSVHSRVIYKFIAKLKLLVQLKSTHISS
jgi:hypothetical protein